MNLTLNKNLCLMYGISFFQGMVFYAPVAALYRQACGLNMLQITLIESISLFLCIALEFPWGILAEKIGYSRTIAVCCGIYFLSKIVFWNAHSFTGFLTERILLSFSLAGLSGVDLSLLYFSVPKEQYQKVCGIYNSLGTGGLVVSSLVFTLFFQDHYRTAALFTVLSYSAAFAASLFLSPLPGHCRHTQTRGDLSSSQKADVLLLLKTFLQNKRVLLFLTGTALLSEMRQNVTVFLSQLQYTRCGSSPFLMGCFYILASLAGLFGFFSFAATKKAGEFTFSSLCFLLSALFCLLLGITENPFLSAACVIGIQLLGTLAQPLFYRLQNEEIRVSCRAAALSLQAVFLECTGAALSPAYGFLADRYLPCAFFAGTISCLAGWGFYVLWYKKRS